MFTAPPVRIKKPTVLTQAPKDIFDVLTQIRDFIITKTTNSSTKIDIIYSFSSKNSFENLYNYFYINTVLNVQTYNILPILSNGLQIANYLLQTDSKKAASRALLNTLVNQTLTTKSVNFVPLLGYNKAGQYYQDNNKIIIAPHDSLDFKYFYLLYPSIASSFNWHTLNEKEFISIWYQLLFSLEIAQQHVSFRHNNLTINNLHIYHSAKPITLQYVRSNGQIIKFDTYHILQIDDFTDSYMLANNFIYGENNSNCYQDVYTCLLSMLNSYNNSEYKRVKPNILIYLMKFFDPTFTAQSELINQHKLPGFDNISPLIDYSLENYPCTTSTNQVTDSDVIYESMYRLSKLTSLFSSSLSVLNDQYLQELEGYIVELPPFVDAVQLQLQNMLYYCNLYYILWYKSTMFSLPAQLKAYYDTRYVFTLYIEGLTENLEPARAQYYLDILQYCKLI